MGEHQPCMIIIIYSACTYIRTCVVCNVHVCIYMYMLHVCVYLMHVRVLPIASNYILYLHTANTLFSKSSYTPTKSPYTLWQKCNTFYRAPPLFWNGCGTPHEFAPLMKLWNNIVNSSSQGVEWKWSVELRTCTMYDLIFIPHILIPLNTVLCWQYTCTYIHIHVPIKAATYECLCTMYVP